MPLVDSLLGAIVRLDGNALVMHVGEKPYVVTGSTSLDAYRGPLSWGQVELATKRLTLEAVAGMVRQLLPVDEQQALSDFGAIEHQLEPNPKVPGRFTVIAARGGDDIWLEIRYHRAAAPETPVQRPAPTAQADQATEPEPAAAPPTETQPLAAEASVVEPSPAAGMTPGTITEAASEEGADRVTLLPEGEGAAPMPVAVEPAVETIEVVPAVEDVTAEPTAEEVTAIEAAMAEAVGIEPAWIEPEVVVPALVEPAVEETAIERAAEVVIEPAIPEAAGIEPVTIEPMAIKMIPGEGVVVEPLPTTPPAEPAWIEPEVAAPMPAAVEPAAETLEATPAVEEVTVEPAAQEAGAIEAAMAEAAEFELVAIEPDMAVAAAESVVSEAAAVEPLPTEPAWIEPEVIAPLLMAVEPADEEVAVEPAVEEAVAIEPVWIEPEVAAPMPAVVESAADAAVEPVMAGPLEPVPLAPAEGFQPAIDVPPAQPAMRVDVSSGEPVRHRTPLDRLLRLAAARGASALYIVTQSPPAIRVDGEITLLESEGLLGSADVAAMLMQPVLVETREAPQEGAEGEWVADVPGVGRVRCLSFRDHRGPGGIFRMLPARALSVEQLGLSRAIQALSAESEGLVIVTGPRASGKQTLISAFVDLVNRTRADHVITLESQILFVHESRRSFVSQRELRGTSQEIAAAARAALRENPDVLVIDDLRSPELIAVALQAAALGLLVFAALPASGARAAIERIVDQFAPEQRAQVQTTLAGALRGVVAQVLVRKIGGGRLAAREVLLNTRAVAAFIAEGRTSELPLAIDDGRRHGMVPLNDALVEAVRAATVDPSEAYRRTYDHEDLLDRLRRENIDTSFVERLA